MTNIPPVVNTPLVTINANEVTVGEKPKAPDKNAARIYTCNALLAVLLVTGAILWARAHVEPFALHVAVGGLTLWAIGAFAISLFNTLGPDKDWQRAWLGRRQSTAVLAAACILMIGLATITRSLYITLANADARRVTIEIRSRDQPAKRFIEPLSLTDQNLTAGRPFLAWFPTTTRLDLVVTEPKGYHPLPVDVAFLFTRRLRFPGSFQQIPVVRVLPGPSLELPRPSDKRSPSEKLHVCGAQFKWEIPGFNQQPVYFGAKDQSVLRAVARRHLTEDFTRDISDHVATMIADDAKARPHILRLRDTRRMEPHPERDLCQGEQLTLVLEIAQEYKACKQIAAKGEITTVFLEEGRCEHSVWRQCASSGVHGPPSPTCVPSPK